MAVYSVQQKYLTDNYAVIALLTNADPLEVGQSVTIAGVDATFNGTYTVVALPQYYFTGVDDQGFFVYDIEAPIANQVLYAKTADNVNIVAASGTLTTTPVCTWITAQQIEDWLGIGTATAADTAFLTSCTNGIVAFLSVVNVYLFCIGFGFLPFGLVCVLLAGFGYGFVYV